MIEVAVLPKAIPFRLDENDPEPATVTEIDCAAPRKVSCGFDALACIETVALTVTSTPTPLDVAPTYSRPPEPARDAAPAPLSVTPQLVIAPDTTKFHDAAVSDAAETRKVDAVREVEAKLAVLVALRTAPLVSVTPRLDTAAKLKFAGPVIDPPLTDTEFAAPERAVEKRKLVAPAETVLLPTNVSCRFVTVCAAWKFVPLVDSVHPLKLNKCDDGIADPKYSCVVADAMVEDDPMTENDVVAPPTPTAYDPEHVRAEAEISEISAVDAEDNIVRQLPEAEPEVPESNNRKLVNAGSVIRSPPADVN